MLDMKFIRANRNAVQDGARRKRIEVNIDELIAADDDRRGVLATLESLKHEQNVAGRKIAGLDGDAKKSAAQEMGRIKGRIKGLESELKEADTKRTCWMPGSNTTRGACHPGPPAKRFPPVR